MTSFFAAQLLLKRQCNGKVHGWKSTQCSKRGGDEKFPPIPAGEPFIQILHVSNNQWITVSNIDVRQKTQYRGTVGIYDSALGPHISMSTEEIICQFVKPMCDVLLFDVMNIQTQPNLGYMQ